MELRDGKAHGVFLLNSNAMDVLLDSGKLQYKVIGGILDFFFFVGPTPKEVTRQYLSLIGTTEMIPYWGLGWQQCRWGYNTLAETQAVVDSYASNGIPLEVMWNDIDYMDAYKDFTTDPVRFPTAQMKQFVDNLHSKGQKYIMIIDPGIKIEAGYSAYEDGLKSDLYIRNDKGSYLTGIVWPGFTFFPDFTHPAAPRYWEDQLTKFHNMVPFDGIWIDMNEVANFCDGECKFIAPVGFNRDSLISKVNAPRVDFEKAQAAIGKVMQKQQEIESASVGKNGVVLPRPKHGKLDFDPNDPPYKPVNGGNPINSHTIDLSAKQYLSLQYNIHSLYGHYEGKATRSAADNILKKRSLIVSRSTFAGSGRHMSHWLGDNHSTWDDLHESIAGVITMGLFGLPHVGADICGFAGNTTKELCTRWIQLGAFYPFSRDHNAIGAIPQEPYVFGPDVAQIAAKVIKIKYSLLPYYYTLHYNSHVTGDPVARGLFYEFSQDAMTADNDVQMMIGPYILISPVLVDGARILNTYLPAATWYDFYTGARTVSAGTSLQLDAPIDKINIHIRGGGIIPLQNPGMTINQSRKQEFNLIVALDANSNAVGDLFLDDGESFHTIQNNQFSYIKFQHTANTLTIQPAVTNWKAISPLSDVTFLGVSTAPTSVTVNGQVYSKSKWAYSATNRRLVVRGLGLSLLTGNTIVFQ
jgi:alpha-glucosidase (family GH31 glycosyl hydrolase)